MFNYAEIPSNYAEIPFNYAEIPSKKHILAYLFMRFLN